MLNGYLKNVEELIKRYSDMDIPQFEGPNRQAATWEDLVWYFIDPSSGRRIRILCTIFTGKKIIRDSGLAENMALPKPYNRLFKIYVLFLCNKNIAQAEVKARALGARHVLTSVTCTLNDIPTEIWRKTHYSNSFWSFCKEHKLIGGKIRPLSAREMRRDRTADYYIDGRKRKLPEESVIQALGQIFLKTFQDVDENGRLNPGGSIDISNALTCSFAVLSLASPNRAAAEIPVLHKQQLKSLSESGGEPVYYLDWQGSKGYRSNKKHVLSALAKHVSKAINFFYYFCEPNRILARYYTDRNQAWDEILDDFEIEEERLKKLSMDCRPNLFTLGYALGFYGLDETVPVVKDLEGLESASKFDCKASFMSEKPIYSISGKDVLYILHARSALQILFFGGSSIRRPKDLPSILAGKELEDWWINYFKTELFPSFPLGFTASETNALVPELLFALRPREISRKVTGTRKYGVSLYTITSPATLAQHARSRLNYRPDMAGRKSIFYEHGYGEMSINPHQLRHYANTIAYMSDISVEFIAAWSGRVDVNQTHEYIHVSEEEKSERIKSIIRFQTEEKNDIRIIAKDELADVTNLPASVTSSGICTQELNVTPCDYLNDFTAQCFMCPSVCHVAGDKRATEFLEKDCAVQEKRLNQVKSDPRIHNSQALRNWYGIHTRNTAILGTLVELMKKYPIGTVIRYAEQTNEFKMTDLATKWVETIKLSLPSPEKEIKQLANATSTQSNKEQENIGLINLLSSFGLTGESD